MKRAQNELQAVKADKEKMRKNLQMEKEKALKDLQLANENAQKEVTAALAAKEKELVRMREERDAMREERDALRGERDAMREERDSAQAQMEPLAAHYRDMGVWIQTVCPQAGVSNLDELALVAINNVAAVAAAAAAVGGEEEKAPSEKQVKDEERESVVEESEAMGAAANEPAAATAATAAASEAGRPGSANSNKAGRKGVGQQQQGGEEDEVERLKAELAEAEEHTTKLSTELFQKNDELVQTKNRLIALAEEFSDLVPVHVFCEANAAEVELALKKCEPFTKKSKKEQTALVQKVNDELDAILRDPRFDPFIRRQGKVVETNKKHEVLQHIKREYGQAIWKLLMCKRLEIEQHNPSGHYPTKVLWKDGKKLKLYEAIEHLHDKLKAIMGGNGGSRK
jgi:chromosome segregation ATPase